MSELSSISEETLLNIARILWGEEGVEVIKVLMAKDDITVDEIAEKTQIQLNDVRKLLYKFYNHSLVTSKRFRDKETGWFIFQWRLQPELIEAFVTSTKQKILRKLEARLEYELSHEFYHCGKDTCTKITFEDAMDTVFHCPYCNEPLRRVENEAIIEFLTKKIAEIKEELED